MAIPLASDWPSLFADFAEPYVLVSPAQTLDVIFDVPTREASLGDTQLSGLLDNPVALAIDADIESKGVVEQSYGVLRDKSWLIDRIEPTGDGVSRLYLIEKQEAEEVGNERQWR